MMRTKQLKVQTDITSGVVLLAFIAALFFAVPVSAISLNPPVVLGEEKGFVTPVGVTADGSNPATANVFVADYGANAILKVDKDKNVSALIQITKPIAVTFNSGKLYVVTESDGIKTYLASDGSLTTPAPFGAGVVKKPSDIVVGSNNRIYITDVKDSNVKVYNMGTSVWETPIGGPWTANTNGHSQFLMPSGIEIASNGFLMVADHGNVFPNFTLTTKSMKCTNLEVLNKTCQNKPIAGWKLLAPTLTLSGIPKGKVQFFDTAASNALKRMYLLHGTNSTEGKLLYAAGIASNSADLYVADSIGNKIFIFDNISVLDGTNYRTTAPLTSNESIQPGWIPVADSGSANFVNNPMTPPSGYTRFKAVATLGNAYDNTIVQLKDMVKIGTGVGSLLVVTDTFGRVFYFTEGI